MAKRTLRYEVNRQGEPIVRREKPPIVQTAENVLVWLTGGFDEEDIQKARRETHRRKKQERNP